MAPGLLKSRTGTIAAGLAQAYGVTGTASYNTAAQAAGNYIVTQSGGNYYSDQALALVDLSSISANPASNAWRSDLNSFYSNISAAPGGTNGFIAGLVNGGDQSQAVVALAQYTVGAYYAGAADESLWRSGLLQTLGQVSGNNASPVTSLGAATWALAKTGLLGNTLVAPAAAAGSAWYNVTLAGLPTLLQGDIVASGAYAGSFYWRFDHTNGGDPGSQAAGYTEDTVWGIMGLAAAQKTNPSSNYEASVLTAAKVLASGVGASGQVSDHIWLNDTSFNTFAGESLMALSQGLLPGDINMDGLVDVADYNIWAANVGKTGAHWAQGDLNGDGLVDVADYNIWAANVGRTASTPEPLTITALAIGGLILLRRRQSNSLR
jgi:hypothetical protein